MARPKKMNGNGSAVAVAEAPQAETALRDPVVTFVTAKTAIVPAQPTSLAAGSAVVRPIFSADEAKTLWSEYIATCQAILEENDYIYFACGKERGKNFESKPIAFRTRAAAIEQAETLRRMGFSEVQVRESKKRSAWDKLARFYGIDTPIESAALCTVATVEVVGEYIIEKLMGDSFKIFVYQDSATLAIRKVSVLLRVVAPNGRTIIGDGACASTERSGFSHADHDIFSTAFTRAFNRGVSRCIGTGEVSAEEFESAGASAAEPAMIASAPVQQVATTQGSTVQAATERSAPLPSQPQAEAQERPALAEEAVRTAAPAQPHPGAPPPRAEIPADLPGKPAPQQPATAANVAASHPDGAFAPLPEAATPSLKPRLVHMEKYLFNSERSEDRLVRYLFFCVAPFVEAPVDIEKNGRWDPDMWNKAMLKLADRGKRMDMLETFLAAEGRESFKKWGEGMVATARARKVFGK